MVRKGIRKSKSIIKPSLEVIPETAPIFEPETGMEKPKVPEQPMVNLRAKIHDVGMLTITVPANKVDKTLEKIWRTGFKQKRNNHQRTHQVYGPHLIDRIDVEPIT